MSKYSRFFLVVCLCTAGGLVGNPARADSVIDGSAAAQGADLDEALYTATFTRAMQALKAKKFEEARALFEQAASQTNMRQDPLSWLAAEFNGCHALCLQGRKSEADHMAREISMLCEATLGAEDPLTSEALGYLAFVLRQHGHLQDAEPVYRHTVQVLEAKYGSEHYLVASALSKHGALLQSMGKLAEAEALQRRALAIVQKIGDDADPNLCVFLTNLAFCLQASHQTEEASQLMDKAFSMVQKTTDAELTSAGQVLRKQAEFYRNDKQLDRAEDLGRRALLRLARRPDINRARFYYYDMVADVYRSILQAKGINGSEIDDRIRGVEVEAGTNKITASASSSDR